MDPFAQIDAYCERLGPGLWAEPINALTNLAFVLAGVVMWHRCRGLPLGRSLSGIVVIIGIGSGLFHTFATGWAAMADVLPILIFVMLYLFAFVRDILGRPAWQGGLAAAAFLPYAALLTPVFAQVSWLGGSASYMPIPLGLGVMALMMWRRDNSFARGVLWGTGILLISITLRTVDLPLCAGFPVGTHFGWHLLNGLMLGWMIEVYRRSAKNKVGVDRHT